MKRASCFGLLATLFIMLANLAVAGGAPQPIPGQGTAPVAPGLRVASAPPAMPAQLSLGTASQSVTETAAAPAVQSTPRTASPAPTSASRNRNNAPRLSELLAQLIPSRGIQRATDNSPYSRYKRRNPTWYFLAIGGGLLLLTLALIIFGLITEGLAILIFFVGIIGFLVFCIGIYWLIFRNRRQLLPRI